MNVLRESVGVISTVPTQCQDTPAPVTLGTLSVKIDMRVAVGVCKWFPLRFMSIHLVCNATWAAGQFGCTVIFKPLHIAYTTFVIILYETIVYFYTCKTY